MSRSQMERRSPGVGRAAKVQAPRFPTRLWRVICIRGVMPPLIITAEGPPPPGLGPRVASDVTLPPSQPAACSWCRQEGTRQELRLLSFFTVI